MDLIDYIEELRVKNATKKTEMARRFGVIYQNYQQWVRRGSLPKEHYPVAIKLLSDAKIDFTDALDFADSVNEVSGDYIAETFDEFFPEIQAGYKRLKRSGRIALLLTLQRELEKQEGELKQKEGGGEKRGNIHTHKVL